MSFFKVSFVASVTALSLMPADMIHSPQASKGERGAWPLLMYISNSPSLLASKYAAPAHISARLNCANVPATFKVACHWMCSPCLNYFCQNGL